ncbi:PREDICTED: centromere protein S-like [Nicrophorus vespilloides]|uniref:Centromere protein S n=1 Tax=Nicrophorus vespilloides TaxID=110193 RepID=A0ABM1N5H0_NICVS|nr:PREDICTED: centromere protein S-like [Nicrophorus vespilloides]
MSGEKKLRPAIHATVLEICNELEPILNVKYEPDCVELIGELVWKKLCLYGQDLEAFSKHAKRTTINNEDVKLLVRRNESLKKLIDDKSKATTSTTSKSKKSTSTIVLD